MRTAPRSTFWSLSNLYAGWVLFCVLLGRKWSCATDMRRERSLKKNLDCREGIEEMPRVESFGPWATFWQITLVFKIKTYPVSQLVLICPNCGRTDTLHFQGIKWHYFYE